MRGPRPRRGGGPDSGEQPLGRVYRKDSRPIYKGREEIRIRKKKYSVVVVIVVVGNLGVVPGADPIATHWFFFFFPAALDPPV